MCARGDKVSSALIGMLCFWSRCYWLVCLLILFVFFIRKLIKLHMLCTVWNFRLFVFQHLNLSFVYIYDSMIIRLFSQLYACCSIIRFFLDNNHLHSHHHYHIMTQRRSSQNSSRMMVMMMILIIFIISQGAEI